MLHLFVIRPGIIDVYVSTEILQLSDHIYNFTVSDIRTILFKGNSQHKHVCTFNGCAFMNHHLDHLVRYVCAHAIINSSTGQNHLWMIAYFLCFEGKVIWIYADTVSTYKPWSEWHEIPFRSCSL